MKYEGKNGIYCKVLKYSYSLHSSETLLSLEVCAPKFIDAQIEKHRMISSNSSSDRAVPVDTLLLREPYIPVDVRKAGKGMQNSDFVSEEEYEEFRKDLLELYSNSTVPFIHKWKEKIHKQHINRYLLPYTFQYKVMTANVSYWQYFLDLRLSSHADPVIYELSSLINKAIRTEDPVLVHKNNWHLPYVNYEENLPEKTALKCSVARCARVSYQNHDGTEPDIEKDIQLFNKLKELKHLSCFEHQAQPMTHMHFSKIKQYDGISHKDKNGLMWSGNFKGWIQLRKLIE